MNNRLKYLIAFTFLFVLNDFAFIPVKSYMGWLAIDYTFRLMALAFITFLMYSKQCAPADFGLVKMRTGPFIAWVVVLSAAGIFIDRFGWRFFRSVLPPTGLFHFPAADNSFAKFFDLTVGVALVSVSEEAIFRGYYASVLRGYFKNPVALVAVSCVLFGLIHWSGGLHAVLATAVWGVLPMISVLKTGSILPAVIAHWATDFAYFIR